MREVQSPDGRVWRIRRRWMPKPPRIRSKLSARRKGDTWLDVLTYGDAPGTFESPIGAILGVIFLVVFVVALVSVILPLIALTLELVFVAVLFAAGAIGRLFLGRPWRIEASTIGAPYLTREVQAKGLRGSREAIDQLAAEIAAGR